MIASLSCYYDPYCSGVIEYWAAFQVSGIIAKLLEFSNSGVSICCANSVEIFVLCQINEGYPKTIKFVLFCKNGHCVLEFGYNWLLVTRGDYSIELSETPGNISDNLLKILELVLTSTQKRDVKNIIRYLSRVNVSLEINKKRVYNMQSFHFKRTLTSRVLPPICDADQFKCLINRLR